MEQGRDWFARPPQSPEEWRRFIDVTMLALTRLREESEEAYEAVHESADNFGDERIRVTDSRARAAYLQASRDGSRDPIGERYSSAYTLRAHELLRDLGRI